MNRHERRAWVAKAAKMARIIDNELYIEMLGKPFKIATLNPKFKHHGITTKKLLEEWISKQEDQDDHRT